MERTNLVNFLCQLNCEEQADSYNNCEEVYNNICKELNCTYEGIVETLPDVFSRYFSREIPSEWKSLVLSFYILFLLKDSLEKTNEDVLSVKQTKTIKECVKNIIKVGICTKLQPNLPLFLKTNTTIQSKDIFLNYNILKCTTLGLSKLIKSPMFRLLILSDNLKEILVSIYQISYCPLKQPSPEATGSNVMTQEIYNRLLDERKQFSNLLIYLHNSIHPGIYVRDTMAILQSNSPTWFKKVVSQSLTNIIRSSCGIENICGALLGGANNDSTQTWKILDIVSKLILSCRNFLDFRENICKQLTNLLDKVTEDTLVYERIYSHCTKTIYPVDEQLTKEIFLRPLVGYLTFFTYKSHKFKEEDLTQKIKQIVRLIYSIFVESTVELPKLPIEILTPVVMVLFRFYTLTSCSSFKSTNEDLKSILLSYLETDFQNIFTIFDSFLFGIGSNKILTIRNDVLLKVDNAKIVLSYIEHFTNYSVTENSDCIIELLKAKPDILVKLFCYLLNCLIHKEKYFVKANEDLLNLEEQFMSEYIERNLVVYKLLSDLAEDKTIQKHMTKSPGDIVSYIETVLKKSIELSTHKSEDTDSSAFQSLFTVLMILQSLMSNSSKTAFASYTILIHPLTNIYLETNNKETKDIVKAMLDILDKGEYKGVHLKVEEIKTDLDKALEDICDPLLPIRGHGLMTLAKLVENKDKNVMERKQYVLNIFQQNLKNEDSYIYLSAIAGLAALADVFTDTVLNVLCEEYSDSSRKHTDGHEVRIKLGETLVRVTKILGEMAPKYKPLLLNTFLIGVKDEDDLIRASSLSNLGEICKVLGYKLGTIITEVLVCVHAVISTDKSPQARRAAVTILRQLFVGLEKEMISFLKDDILPIYRTLKEIYNGDKDEIMRLQAQLALEELNENVKQFVLPNPQLHTEKKVIMLD